MGRARKSDSDLLRTSVRATSESARSRSDLDYYVRTRERKLAHQRELYRANRVANIRRAQKHNDLAWRILSELIGDQCVVCGEADPIVLNVDHKAPLLRAGRRATSGPASSILVRLRDGRENPFNLQVLCANCHARKTAAERRYLFPNPVGRESTHRKSLTKVRAKLHDALGGVCSFCGESDATVLVVDHKISRGGRSNDKRDTGPSSTLAALRNGRESPFSLQLLCANCHARKTAMEFHHYT